MNILAALCWGVLPWAVLAIMGDFEDTPIGLCACVSVIVFFLGLGM